MLSNTVALRQDDWDIVQDLQALNRFSEYISTFLNTTDLQNAGLKMIKDLLDPDRMLFYRSVGPVLRLSWSFPEVQGDAVFETHDRESCLCGEAVRTLSLVFSRDLNNDGRCSKEECKQDGLNSIAILPLLLENRLYGLIVLGLKKSCDVEKRRELLIGMASHFSLALSNVHYMERYRMMLEYMPGLMVILDHKAQIKYITPQIRLKYAYNEEELNNKPFKQILAPDDAQSLEEAIRNLSRDRQECSLDLRIKTGDEYRWTHWSFYLRDTAESSAAIIGVAQDVHIQKAMEQSLHRETFLNKQIIDNADMGICVMQESRGSLPVSFSVWNHAMEKVTGYTLQEIGDIGWADALFPEQESREQAILSMVRLIRDGNIQGEWTIQNRLGEDRILMAQFRLIGQQDGLCHFVGLIRDITDQKEFESRIRAEKERLAVTLRSIGDGVITTDLSGKISSMNRMAEKICGWSQDEALGRDLVSILKLENHHHRTSIEELIHKVMTSGEIQELPSHTLLTDKHGEKKLIEDSLAPIKNPQSETIGLVVVFNDVTEKQKLMEAAATNQKLESLGVLAGGIAHDFNNLLGGIFGFIDLARGEISGQSEALNYIDEALDAMDRARGLTHQLLTFAKGGAPVKKDIELRPFLEKNVRFALSGSSVNPVFTISSDLWVSQFDPDQLGQVINNLVLNAVQAMSGRGTLRITARNSTEEEVRKINLESDKYVTLSITDEGIGIPPDILTSIFDPFFTTKTQGHGLGLSLCHSILRRHGGSIEVESVQGKGTTFTLLIPASEGQEPAGGIEYEEKHEGSGRVLIMDDEKMIREILSRLFASMGYEVDTACNGQEALEKFEQSLQNKEGYSALFFDLTIPGGMGGREAVTLLRKKDPDIPVFVCSGYASDEIMANPTQYGFTASINKPFSRKEIEQIALRYLKKESE